MSFLSLWKQSESHVDSTQISIKLTDYNLYIMSKAENVFYTAIAAVVIYFTGFIFYHNLILSVLLCPLALLYPKMRTKKIIEKRKNELNLQFKDMLYSLSSSLSSGKSVESAFRDILRDLAILYPDSETDIIKEVEYIIRRIELNETVESALTSFSKRAHLEDVENFVDVFHTCKRTGGNIVEVIKNASNIINDKIEIKQEINTLLAEKKFEQKVLNIMPALMIILLSVSAQDYMAPVFNTIAGRIAMTASIVLLAAAYFISNRIMEIEV